MAIYNIHPDKRYQKQNLALIMVIPGKGKPKDLESFLAPVFEELKHLSNIGIKVVTGDEGTITAKIHLMTFIGDIPAVSVAKAVILRLVWMYFVGRTDPSLIRQPNEFKDGGPQGIGASAVARLPTFTGPHFFGLDEMHMIGHGLSKMLLALFQPSQSNPMVVDGDNRRNYPFFLGPLMMSSVGQDMLCSQPDIPESFFNGIWDDIDKYPGSARAVDWMDFLLFAVPTLIVPSLHHSDARQVINNLIKSIHLCLSWKLSSARISFIKTSIDNFQDYLAWNITAGHLNRKCCTINLHYLGHVSFIIQCLGPLPIFSCRSLERTIGHYKSKSLPKSSPGSSYQLILEKQSSSNINHALAALGEGSVPDLMLLGKPDRSSAPPDPVSYDILHDATMQYFQRQGNHNIPFTYNFDLSYHRSIKLKGKVYRSLFFNPAGTTVNLGQSTVLFTTGSNDYFFGVVHFFFHVQLAGCSHNLLSLQLLKGVSKSNRVDSNIYPTWRHAEGFYDPLIVINIDSMVDGVGIITDSTHSDIKHLVPSRQHIWNLTVLTNFDDILEFKLRSSRLY
ncbi:hypothetical protein [Absidia glauca]|uniref:Uncharacterized protein n=1 Tax=Absidia glauca TaxID=4829 RepID=A0A163KP25_ABSGL|nr:hypothetical protein [Absidia glauca]